MAEMTNLESIRARDTASGDLWFKGPESFTALAARDRRALLAEVEHREKYAEQMNEVLKENARLTHDIEAGNAEIERLCKLHGSRVEPRRDTEDAPCLMCGEPRLAHRLARVHQGMFDPRMPPVCPKHLNR